MGEADDKTLLREYSEEGSERAFEALVGRYVNLVYSAALRQVRDAHLAQEVAQAVFVILARKAGSLRGEGALAGWLYKTVRFTASAQMRSAVRRQRRELEAQMDLTTTDEAKAWELMEPLLDEALMGLGEKDRQAVLLRYFQGKRLGEVGAAMATNEEAARKRIGRALLRLREFFSKRGVALSLTVIGGALASNSAQAAPVGLAASAAATALLQGTTHVASTTVLVKAAMKLMALAKLKTAVAVGTAALLAVGTVGVATGVLAQDAKVPESAWMRIDSRTLNSLPAAFILRPTDSAGGGGMAVSGNKIMARGIPLRTLLSLAYDVDPAGVKAPADATGVKFDLLMTEPDASLEQLQREIKRALGYVGEKRKEEADVYVLKYRQGGPGLRRSEGKTGGKSGGSVSSMSSSSSSNTNGNKNNSATSTLALAGQTIPSFIKNIQGRFDRPILDATGLEGKFDISLQWSGEPAGAAIQAAMPGQIGMELEPAREMIETLAVEKVK